VPGRNALGRGTAPLRSELIRRTCCPGARRSTRRASAFYSTLMLAALMTGHHFSISAL
jgi:hypothetical protein